MIRVTTADHDDGVRIVVDGHASEPGEPPSVVCAAVSTLVATALTALGAEGGPGHNDLVFRAAGLELADWTMLGLDLIATAYPTDLTIDRGDTRLRRPAP